MTIVHLFIGKINRGRAAAPAPPAPGILQIDNGPPEFADILEAYPTIEGLFNKYLAVYKFTTNFTEKSASKMAPPWIHSDKKRCPFACWSPPISRSNTI